MLLNDKVQTKKTLKNKINVKNNEKMTLNIGNDIYIAPKEYQYSMYRSYVKIKY